MPRKIIPYVFLGILVLIIIITASVRYGISVEKHNKTNEFIQDLIVKLSLTPTPKSEYQAISDATCRVTYVIPKVQKPITIACPHSPSASEEAQLLSEGYVKKRIGTSAAYLKVPEGLESLIDSSIHLQ